MHIVYARDRQTRTVALSVATSARTSPAAIASPTAFFQETRVPLSIVGDSAGIPSAVCAGKDDAARVLKVWRDRALPGAAARNAPTEERDTDASARTATPDAARQRGAAQARASARMTR